MRTANLNLADSAEAAMTRGDAEEAIRLAELALKSDPKDYRSLVLMSYVLRVEGKPEASSVYSEKAIRLRPGMVEAYFQYGLATLQIGRPQMAVEAFLQCTRLRPEIPVFHLNLALAYEHLGRHNLALKSYENASSLSPNDTTWRLASVARLTEQERFADAESELEGLEASYGPNPEVMLARADLKIAQGDPGGAEQFIRTALAQDPNNSKANARLGSRYSQLGQFELAQQQLLKSVELEPLQGYAYLGFVQSKKVTEADRPLIAQMEAIRDSTVLPPGEAAALRFALAKAYDNLHEYERAMRLYDEAHKLAYLGRFGQEEFDSNHYRTLTDEIIKDFPRALQQVSASDEDSRLPILVVGMIRSGTTLTEQILARHPQVGAGGEQLFWHHKAGTPELHHHLAEHPDAYPTLRREYAEMLRAAAPGFDRVTDKLPGNYFRLGLIASIFPRAKIVYCKRNAVDNALSIYTTPLRMSSAFSHAKETIVTTYREHERLMAHWETILPAESLLEVRYERLVSDPETEIRRLLAFCDLEWDDRCLNPEAGENEVKTASLWQVRQPIYRTSVERWRAYEPWLGALQELVETDA